MGAYTWLSEMEFDRFSKVEDKEVNEVLQQVREINPVWFIDERHNYKKRLFRPIKKETMYTVYEVFVMNGVVSKPEVRVQMSVVTKRDLLNFLYGLNIGYHFNL